MVSESVYTIITAAGDSKTQFLGAGFAVPKSLVEIDGVTVLSRAIKSYTCEEGRVIVALNRHEENEWQVAEDLSGFSPSTEFVTVSPRVQGALATAVLATENVPLLSPLVITAGDSEIHGGISSQIREFIDLGSDAGTIVFPSANPRWSYLSLDDKGVVNQVAEKSVVGPYATTGVFFFKSCEVFLKSATWCFLNAATVKGQYYVATALNQIIAEGLQVDYKLINRDSYKSWSLPVDFIEQAN